MIRDNNAHPGRFAEAQAILDQALNSPFPLRLTLESGYHAERFRAKIYKLRNQWKREFLRRNGNLTRTPLDPANLREVDSELLAQMKEAYPDMKTIKTYHWQSPYEYVSVLRVDGQPAQLLILNTQFAHQPESSVLKVEVLEH